MQLAVEYYHCYHEQVDYVPHSVPIGTIPTYIYHITGSSVEMKSWNGCGLKTHLWNI
jgi:hypothetical protein